MKTFKEKLYKTPKTCVVCGVTESKPTWMISEKWNARICDSCDDHWTFNQDRSSQEMTIHRNIK